MSSCGGNCNCGSSCKCGSGGGCCKRSSDLTEETMSTTQTVILGVAPQKDHVAEGFESEFGAENGGCKCGSNCSCDPCSCK